MRDEAHVAAVHRDFANEPIGPPLIPVLLRGAEGEGHLFEISARQLRHYALHVGVRRLEFRIHFEPPHVFGEGHRAAFGARQRQILVIDQEHDVGFVGEGALEGPAGDRLLKVHDVIRRLGDARVARELEAAA